MMKKTALWTGFLIALLLLCVSACAQADAPQPTVSAAQWKSKGAVVLSDSDDPGNFIVLRKDICYLKEKTPGGKPGNGNRFTLSDYDVVQPQNSVNGQDAYCVEAGGKLYFGVRDAGASDGNTLVLKQDQMLITDGITPQTAIAAAAYTLGAWIDWDPDFDLDDVKIKDIPFDFHGDVHFFLDHWSDSAENTTHHTIQCYFELNMDDMGFATDTETTTDDAHVPIFSYRGIKIIYVSIKLDHFKGDLGVGFSIHDGLKIYFDTWGVVPISGIDAERDGPRYDSQVSNAACHGDAEIGFEAGIGSSVEPLVQNQSLTIGFGYTIEGTDNKDRFVPADTKVKWHACDECWNEDVRDRIGPVNVVYDLLGFDPWTWSSDDYETDPWYFWYYSKTFDDYGSGECPHYSYRLDATVVNQHDNPIPNVNVNWKNPDTHYEPQASGTTDASGSTVIYVLNGEGREITAEVTSTLDPTWTISQTKTITKNSDKDELEFKLNIPEKHVYFRNSESGEATGWPADIPFMPFFSENVQIPDTVPGLSGRVFTGWNTKEDGSGTSYAPGTGLILSDDLTLWAQWKVAGNEWYVIYNANGGTKAPGPQEIPLGKDAVLTTELPEAGKMIFKGWTPDLTKMDPVYQPGDTLKYDSRKDYVVLYAIWDLSPIPQPIHISFERNGLQEAVLPPDVWFEQGSWLQLRPAEPAYGSAWSFAGWSENPRAETPEFPAGRSYYFYKDTVLYAIWNKADTVTLTFRDPLPDPVKGLPDPITILPSMSREVKIPSGIPEKSGRVFTGWNTAKDGSGRQFAPGSLITLTEDTTLWAQWKNAADSWYVIYDANGGRKAPALQVVPKGTDAVLTRELPDGGALVFKGWTQDLLHPDPVLQPGDTLKYDSKKNYVVLHAIWDLSPEGRPVVVTFHANGGRQDTVPHSVSAPAMTWFRLPEEKPAWDGQHEFLGWSRDPEAAQAEMNPGSEALFEKDTKLYAVWRARYRVTEGAGSVWIKGSGKKQRFVADGNITYFTELRIDGKRFDDGVEITSGSTVADISARAMEKLSVGKHTVTFAYEDGEASAPFSVQPKIPPTGDADRPALWLVLVLLGLSGLVLAGPIARAGRKKK